MFPLGHLGITLGVAIALARSRPFLVARMDLRFVLFGAVLPDLIDKLSGHVVLAGSLDNGRLIGHTLVFSLIFIVIGVGLTNDRLLTIGFAGGVHLGLDLMWYMPSTLLWPGFGLAFPEGEFEVYDWLTTLATDPFVQAGEVLGGAILLWFVLRHGLYRRERMVEFLLTGETRAQTATSAAYQK